MPVVAAMMLSRTELWNETSLFLRDKLTQRSEERHVVAAVMWSRTELWNEVIQPLQKIQNFTARLVFLAPRYHHSTPLLENLDWLPISERVKYKMACMCFSAINGSVPAYLSELLHVYTPFRALRSSSDTRMLENLAIQTQDSWLLHFLLLWTPHLEFTPQDLRHCSTLSTFKAKLKTFLTSGRGDNFDGSQGEDDKSGRS